jgi:acetone carboxylase alpha subunit
MPALTTEASRSLKRRLKDAESNFRATGTFEPDLELKAADPIQFEVLFTRLQQLVTNAREVGALISASPSTREQGEIIFGLYTPEGDAICLSTGLMIHVHTISRAIKWMIEHDYEQTMEFREGDLYFNNDSFIGGGHPSDQMLITPLYIDGELEGWVGGLTHVTETGAVEPGALGTSITSRFAEGLILPCVKVGENDTFRPDLDILVSRSVRTAIPWMTDNRAKLTGLTMVREAVKEIVREVGIDHYRKTTREYIEDTLRATRVIVQNALHPGRYREVAWRGVTLDGQESVMQAPCELVVTRDGRIRMDWDGVSSSRAQPFQATLPLFEGMLFNSLFQNVFFDLRYNDGTFLAIELNVPEGTACHTTDIFLPTLLWGPAYAGAQVAGQCISRAYYAQGFREEVHAVGPCPSGNLAGGIDQYGRHFGAHCFELAASGMYGTAVMDGLDTAITDFNPEGDMGDAEIWEQSMPPVFLVREPRRDGGGFGKFRGGSGIHTLYLVPSDMEMGSFGSAPIYPSPGLMGGYPSSRLYAWVGDRSNIFDLIESGKELPLGEGEDPARPDFVTGMDAEWQFVSGQNRKTGKIARGSLYSVVSGDAGGFGDPIERDPELVALDVAGKITSARAARDVYCVALDEETLQIDRDETERLRLARREQRLSLGVPAQEYRAATRKRVLAGDFSKPVRELYSDVLSISERFAAEFRDFWDLPADFTI